MASLPPEQQVPCPPFSHVGLDLVGPVVIKKHGEKSTRTFKGTFKGWVVQILCLNTKAVKLFLSCGYSTEDFLLSYEQFVSDHGTPVTVHSDRGSQLVSAAGEVESLEYN